MDTEQNTNEWLAIKKLFEALRADARFTGLVLQGLYQVNRVIARSASPKALMIAARKVDWCMSRIDALLRADGEPVLFAFPVRRIWKPLRESDLRQ